jgi:hypothetical protein
LPPSALDPRRRRAGLDARDPGRPSISAAIEKPLELATGCPDRQEILAAGSGLEPVGEQRILEFPRRPKPGHQVGGRAVAERQPREGEEPLPEPRLRPVRPADHGRPGCRSPRRRSRQERRFPRRPVEHGDLAWLHAGAEKLEDLRSHQLRFSALSPGFEQPDGPVRRSRDRLVLEQGALEVVQRGASPGRVVLRPLREHDVLIGERSQGLDRARPPAKAARPASYGSATVTSAPASLARLSTASSSVGVRSSNP